MRCPSCQFDNREGAKFCIECGNSLEINCSNCSHLNPPESKFCEECGSKLSFPVEQAPKGLPLDEKLTKIQKYLPKGLTEKILSQKDRIEGERKQVTVMFCDMEGFTHLSEMLGIEDAYAIMDRVYEILIHKVHDYEGTVNEMTGDGIMALFGAPIALEDAPQRAIRSAMAIHREMSKFSDRVIQEKEDLPPLKMRVGIHTGPVVVGTLGNDLRVEFKAVGNTVNLASRVESLAVPGSTYVTDETFKLSEGLFRFEALGQKQVKGKKEPIKVYRVIAPSTRRTRFDVSAERGLTPFVGRQRELELLLDGFERAKSGRGQAFSIISEAGVGKSRLLYEFRKAVTSADVMFLEGRCLSYSRGIAYHPIIDILKASFDIREGDEDSKIKEKVKKGLKILGMDEASTLPYFLELFSVKDSGIDKIPMSPEARTDRIMEACKLVTLKGSEIRPLITAYEDLHWVDKSSEYVLKYVLEGIPGAKVLMIFTYRPEFVHTWGAKSYHNQINLNRLSNRESISMVYNLLSTESIDRDLEELILEKTEGVPFFIEEFIRSLIDLKIIEKKNNTCRLVKDIQDVTIPTTIQDVIMARVDSLPEGAKEVLQTASAIEREFNYELIKRVTVLPEQDLLSHLSALKDSEFLYERGIYPQSTYIFKHAMTQEVVYDSILAKKKKQLHKVIGNAIQELYKKNIDEYYGVLARHYIMGENYEKGAEYSKLSAENSEKTGSISVAVAYAKETVTSLEKLSRTDDMQARIIDARTALGVCMMRMFYYSEAKEAVEPIVDLALKSEHKRALPQILTIVGNYEYFVNENVEKAFKYFEDALKILEEKEDNVSLAVANWRLAVSLSMSCKFEKGAYYFEKALSLNAAANNLWGISLVKSFLVFFIYFHEGKINLANKASDEAIRIAEESGDIYSKAFAYTAHGISCWGKGFFENAIKFLLQGVDFCEKINLFMWNVMAQFHLAQVYFETGEYQKSKDHYEKAVKIMENNRAVPSWMTLMKIGIEMAKVMKSEKDIHLGPLYSYIHQNKLKIWEGYKLRFIGELLLNIGDQHLSEAEDCIQKAIKTHKRDGMMWHLGRDYALYTELLKRQDDQLKAKENLNKAIDIFKACGAEGWVKKYEKELASLSC